MDTIVRVDGWPVAPGTAEAFLHRLKPAFEKAFPGVTLHVYSGYRSYEDQVKIFTERYRRGAHSPYGDYRWWDGSLWGRISGAGTVAAPGTSNHQSGHALDIRDSGSDAGVTIAGNARSNWIRAHASRYGFNPAGYGFAEPWHIEYTGDPWAGGQTTGGGGVAPITSEEDDMLTLKNVDTGRIYQVGQEYIKHLDGPDGEHKALADAGLSNYIEVKSWSFDRILSARGIPEGIVNGAGDVLNDLEGKGHEKYGSWSRVQKTERLAWLAQEG